MPATGCERFQGLLAEDAVGRISGGERLALDAHLAGCASCRADAADVSGAAGALAWIGPAVADELGRTGGVGTEVVPTGALDAAVAGILAGAAGAGDRDRGAATDHPGAGARPAVGEDVPRTLRQRAMAPVLAVAAAALLVSGVFAVSGHGPAATRSVELAGPAGARATALLTSEAWGTSVTLTDPARRADQVLTVSMTTEYGHRWDAGSYRVTTSHGVTVTLACALPVDQIQTIAVTDATGHVVLAGRQPEGSIEG